MTLVRADRDQQRRPARAGARRAASRACRRELRADRPTTARATTSRSPAPGRSRTWSIRCPRRPGSASTSRIDLGGQVRFGPDVEWVDGIDYDVDPRRAEVFYAAIRTYYPGLKDGAIEPGYAGMRPKISPKGTQAADFVIQGPREHGVPGLVNLFAIESPGLTASLALAEEVERALEPVAQPGRLSRRRRCHAPGRQHRRMHDRAAPPQRRRRSSSPSAATRSTPRSTSPALTGERDVRVDYVTALGDDAYSDAHARDVAGGRRRHRAGRAAAGPPAGAVHDPHRRARRAQLHLLALRLGARATCCRTAAAEQLRAALAGYDLLYLSGITLSILDPPQRAALVALADAVRAQGGRVAFDSNYRPVGWPDPEAARARVRRDADAHRHRAADARRRAGAVRRRRTRPSAPTGCIALGVAEVAIKLGPAGCFLSSALGHRRDRGRAGRRGGRQHRGRRQLQRRLPRRAPARRRAAEAAARLGNRSPPASSPTPARSSRPGDGGPAGALSTCAQLTGSALDISRRCAQALGVGAFPAEIGG